jgi:hypothetical protein
MEKDDDEEIDAMENTGRHVVAEIEESVKSWLDDRRKQAQTNDLGEDTERQRYFREREEAIRARDVRAAEKLRDHVSPKTLDRLLADLAEQIE